MTCRHQAAGNFVRSEIYFFLATLRVFFAVFFTALFAFLAFLAMMPSDVVYRCVHSGIEMHYIPNTPTHLKKQRLA